MNFTKMSHGGRVVIPAEMRQKLNLREGDALIIEERDGELILSTPAARLAKAQQLFKSWFPTDPGSSLVAELIDDRRSAASSEVREGGNE